MENFDDNKLMLNQILVKILWFYQILIFEKVKFRGRYNVYKSIFVILMVYQCLISFILCLSGFYYWTNNTIESMMYFMISINLIFANYKMFIIYYYLGDIWNCLTVTKFNFTNYGHQHRHILDLWRNLSIKLMYTFTILCFLLGIGMAIYPLALNNTFLVMRNHDGMSSNYRLNVINLYLLFVEEIYNAYFYVFYIIEIFSVIVLLVYVNIADTILNTLCLAIICQFQTICNTFKLVGHNMSLRSPNSK